MELHMPQIIAHYLPELDEPELSFIERLTVGMSHENIQQFALGGHLKSGHVWSLENRP
jgi:hypothetical protein